MRLAVFLGFDGGALLTSHNRKAGERLDLIVGLRDRRRPA
jgi:hypothetical protein